MHTVFSQTIDWCIVESSEPVISHDGETRSTWHIRATSSTPGRFRPLNHADTACGLTSICLAKAACEMSRSCKIERTRSISEVIDIESSFVFRTVYATFTYRTLILGDALYFTYTNIMESVMDTFTVAVDRAGSLAELCRRLSDVPGFPKVTPQIFSGWRRRNQIPDGRVWQVSFATGIPPWEIRPDLYDRPEDYLAKVSKAASKSIE